MGSPGHRDGASGFGGLRHRARYRFDNLLARGTWATLVWLGVVTLAAVLVSSLLLLIAGVTLAGSSDGSWLEDFWQSLLRMLDPGTMAGDVGWGRRLLALVVTVFGLLVAGTLIGVIASGVEDRIERMRRGRSIVIETDHVVVLGDSDRLPVLVHQLVMAGASRDRNTIVVLADRDPAELNDAVRRVVLDRRGCRIVYRSGDPTRRSDLALVRLRTARRVIVLPGGEAGDARAVSTVLAVGAELGGFDRVPIVVEVADGATAESLVRACGDGVHPIVASQAVARSAAYALREPGLSQVVSVLLDAGGADIQLRTEPELVGLTFGEVVGRFADARPIGRMRPDGAVELVPPPAARFEEGDRLVVVADHTGPLQRVADPGPADSGRAPHPVTDPVVPPDDEHLVVVGWNDLGALLLGGWAMSASPASTVEIAFDPRLCDPEAVVVSDLDENRLTRTPAAGIAGLIGRPDAPSPTTVVLLSYAGRLPVEEADSRTLLELMVLRRELAAHGGRVPTVVVELLDTDNLPLARLPGADDYLVSQAIGSQMIAQLAEQPERRPVYLALYAPDRPSIHLLPAEGLGLRGDVTASEVAATSYAAGVVAIGWRLAAARGGAVTLNPHAGRSTRLEPGDEIVVVGWATRPSDRAERLTEAGSSDVGDAGGTARP